MRSFSKHNLINDELKMLPSGNLNWIDRIFYGFYKKVKLNYTLSIPASTYLRAEAFCEDVSELSEVNFDQRDLLSLLYDGFLYEVREMDDVEVTYTQLMMTHQIYCRKVPIKIKNNVSNDYKERFSSYLMIDEENKLQNLIQLEVSFERKKALRGEILLADMHELFPDHPFTFEKILEILMYDFIEEYKKGNHKDAMRKIVKSLTAD